LFQSSYSWSLIVSDGVYCMQGILATQISSIVSDGKLPDLSVFRAEEYQVHDAGDKMLVLFTDLKVLSPPIAIIGSPTLYNPNAPAVPAPVPTPMTQTRTEIPPLQSSPYAARFPPTGGSVVKSMPSHNEATIPISLLNPYNNRWTIKARVVAKSTMRTWNNARGTGRVFSVDLLDHDVSFDVVHILFVQEGEIRASMFNDSADKFYNVFEVNRVYYISKGTVKMSNKQYTSHLKNDYEIVLNSDAEVQLADDAGEIKKVKFAFCPIEKIGQHPKDSFVDVIAVVQKVGPIATIVSQKTSKELTKRTLTLVDQSHSAVFFIPFFFLTLLGRIDCMG